MGKKILIIANARWKGGLSGGDNIYLNFAKRWPADVDVWHMMNYDFKPFFLCYIFRIIGSIVVGIFDFEKYDIVYSASDFLMDSIPAFLYKITRKIKGFFQMLMMNSKEYFKKGGFNEAVKLTQTKWIAGFYLEAPKNNAPYRLSQFIAKPLIRHFADMVFITNSHQKHLFPDKKTVEVHGGVDFKDVKWPPRDAIVPTYDAVFCGRIHQTKGIDDLIDIWSKVIAKKPDAKLAVIGDGDLGIQYVHRKLWDYNYMVGKSITLFGYMDHERFNVYKASKLVLYPTRSHFSMSPVEAMACGCPMVTYRSDVMSKAKPEGTWFCNTNNEFAEAILYEIEDRENTGHVYAREAYLWAKAWNWENRAQTIYKEMIEGLETKGKE